MKRTRKLLILGLVTSIVEGSLIGSLAAKEPKPENEASSQEEAVEEKPKAPAYNGLVLQMNDQWSLKFSGQLNGFFTYSMIKDQSNTASIQNGLLPASLIINPTFKVNDNVSITGSFGLWFGIPSSGVDNSKRNSALDFSAVDIRNLFFDISTPAGSFLVGRDFGRFGLDAILNDISLLGVGANYSFVNPLHTTLGGIGYGYLYCDRLVQINYKTPSLGGLTLMVGIYDAIEESSTQAGDTLQIGFHAKLAFQKNFSKNVSLNASAAFITQPRTSIDATVYAFDVFAKLNVYGFSAIGHFYYGSGIGDVGIVVGGTKVDANGNTVAANSLGFYGQASYTINTAIPITIGAYVGRSFVEDNFSQRITGSIAVSVLPYLILRGEFTHQNEQVTLTSSAAPEANIIAVGATLAF